jgi:hypothetical protein
LPSCEIARSDSRAVRRRSNPTISWQPDKRDSQEGAPIDSQITFANEVVAAMENRLTEHRAMVGMRQARKPRRRRRPWHSHGVGPFLLAPHLLLAQLQLFP